MEARKAERYTKRSNENDPSGFLSEVRHECGNKSCTFWQRTENIHEVRSASRCVCHILAYVSMCKGDCWHVQCLRIKHCESRRDASELQSVSGRFTDFVVNLGEGFLTAQLLSQSVIQPPVKHLPELLPVHVHVCIEHLEPAGGRYHYYNACYVFARLFKLVMCLFVDRKTQKVRNWCWLYFEVRWERWWSGSSVRSRMEKMLVLSMLEQCVNTNTWDRHVTMVTGARLRTMFFKLIIFNSPPDCWINAFIHFFLQTGDFSHLH